MKWLWCLMLFPALAWGMGNKPQKPVVTLPGKPGLMIRDDHLRANPDPTAASLASLKKGDGLRILKGEGGWTQVYAEGRTGWVRILSVKSESGASADLGSLADVTAERDPGKVVAVAGARGLDEIQLKSARFNADEIAMLNQYQATAQEAREHARQAGLTPGRLDYLAAPSSRDSSPLSIMEP